MEKSKADTSYIFRQSHPSVADLRYGAIHRRFADVGCGVAAVYNVMLFLGKPQAIPDIIRDAESLKMPWLFGMFGTKPKSLGRYFSKMGVPYRQTDSAAQFREALKTAGCAVICTWNERKTDGIHFFTILRSGDSFTSLNQYCDCDRAVLFSPDAISESRFITGYLFS